MKQPLLFVRRTASVFAKVEVIYENTSSGSCRRRRFTLRGAHGEARQAGCAVCRQISHYRFSFIKLRQLRYLRCDGACPISPTILDRTYWIGCALGLEP